MTALLSSAAISAQLPEIVEEEDLLRAGEGWLMEKEGLRVAYFKGSPQEIGIQHGLLVVDDPESMQEAMQLLDPASQARELGERIAWFFKDLYARFKFIPAFKRHIPDEYLQEMEGFIIGASRGEESNYHEIIMSNSYQDLELAGPGCSAFAAWGEASRDGELYLGRNLDHLGMLPLADYQYLAFYQPEEGYPFAVHNYPSFVGTMSGMNSQGIVITSNYSPARSEEVTIDGLPYMIMIRQALQYGGSLEEVIEIIKETPRTVGLNLMIADAEANKAVVAEVTASRIQIREKEDFIYASNMYRDPHLQQFQDTGWHASTLRDNRFARLGDQLWGEMGIQEARDIMRDRFHPESTAGRGFVSGINDLATIASMVFAPQRGEIWVSTRGDSNSPDGSFIGFNARKIWERGQPVEPIGLLPPTERDEYLEHWFKVREAEMKIREHRDHQQVIDLLQPVLDQKPKSELPLLYTARGHLRLGEYSKGLEYLRQFTGLQEHAEPYYLLQGLFLCGLLSDHLGEREEALECYRRILELEIEDYFGEPMQHHWARIGLEEPLALTEEGGVKKQ